jgi:hypothetical protein
MTYSKTCQSYLIANSIPTKTYMKLILVLLTRSPIQFYTRQKIHAEGLYQLT